MTFQSSGAGVVEAEPAANGVGAIVLATALCLVSGVYLLWSSAKWRARRGHSACCAGATRLAAARGLVQRLESLSVLPEFEVEAALNGFTALSAAAAQGRAGRCWPATPTARCASCLLLA